MAEHAPAFTRLNPRQDVVFKLLFSQHPDLLSDMLEAVLGRSIRSLELLNPGLPADVTHAKIIALDLRVVLDDGTRVDVEMQARVLVHNRARFLYYSAREYAGQLSAGEDYSQLHPAASVIWLDESMFPELDQLHSVFELRERKTGALYSEHLELHVLQLAKLPFARHDEQKLQRWARFLAAQSSAEYLALARESPIMAHATKALDNLSRDPEAQRMARDRADSEKLYAMSLRASREEGHQSGLAEGHQSGLVEGHQSGLTEGHQSGLTEGLKRGQLRALLRILAARNFELTPAQKARIESADVDALEIWLGRAASIAEIEELFARKT